MDKIKDSGSFDASSILAGTSEKKANLTLAFFYYSKLMPFSLQIFRISSGQIDAWISPT